MITTQKSFSHASLFSGIGGFDLAAQWMGWENVFHCEWNEFGKRILKHYWPKSISYNDITKTDFTIHRGKIDVLSGGFPCQPYSHAGKRLGKEDDRHLWPEMLRAIREIKPTWVVGENVSGLIDWDGGLVFEEVQTDLENEGYEVQAYLLPACAVNAPHRRNRIWFIAYSNKCTTGQSKIRSNNRGKSTITDKKMGIQKQAIQYNGCSEVSKDVTNTYDPVNEIKPIGSKKGYATPRLSSNKRNVANTNSTRQGKFSITNWGKFPTQSPICSRNDGISNRLDGITFPRWRNESIKGYGNAVVPQLVHQIFKAIEQY